MHKSLKKLLALLLAVVLVLGIFPAALAAEEPEEASATEPVSGTIHPTGRRSVEHPGNHSLTDAYLAAKADGVQSTDGTPKTAFPSSYNSNTLGYVTPVRNQGNYGTCWAHGALGSVESYMIRNGIVNNETGAAAATSMNLSEYQLAWYCFTYAYDKLGMLSGDNSKPYSNYLNLGGFGEIPTYTLMRWEGPASESVSALAYSKASSSGLGSTYAYAYNVAHVTDVDWIPTANMDAVKQAIMDYGAGTFGYDHEDAGSNDSTGAYCYLSTSAQSNHDVTVVGWDDNYSRTNFNSSNRPTNNGAWIIKNSWGTSYGDNGYYYISYEDYASLNDTCYFYKVGPVDNYDNIYQYDGTSNFNNYQSFSTNNPYVANVFTANGSEILKAVALCTWDEGVSYNLSIYTDPTSATDPASGTLAASQSGTIPYMGYHTIVLDTPVNLNPNQTYSVVFQVSTAAQDSDGNYLYMPYDYSGSSTQFVTWTHATHSNTSFYKNASASSWTSLQSGKGSFRIKAYTTDYTAPAYEITAVSNNEAYGTVELNGAVITATPKEGYEVAGYEVTSGTATVTRSGNNFTVVPTSACTVQINFAPRAVVTVSFMANGEAYGTPVSGYAGDQVLLPASATEVEGWTFSGWSDVSFEETTEKPAFYAPGAAYYPTADTTLYAVYTKTEGGDQPSNQYALYEGDLEAGDYLVVYDNSAMKAQVSNNRLAFTDVTPSDNVITTDDTSLVWTLSSENIGGFMYWRLYNDSTSSYAAATSNNNRATLLSSVTDYARWSVTVADGTYDFQNKATSRYLRKNGSYGFAAYAATTGGPLSLYKNVPAGTTTYTLMPAAEVPCAHDGATTETRVEPTCTEAGSVTVTCDLCGAVLSVTELPALGHTPAAAYSHDDANHWHVCTVCGESVGDEEAHTWNAGVVTTEPTADDAGVMTYTCTLCEHAKTEAIPALGHDYTVTFTTPEGVTAPAPMTCNSITGITLPTAEAPEGYTFLGWVTEDYDNVATRPEEILTGTYAATADITLKALYSYADGAGGDTYNLVTDPADLIAGSSVIITANGTKNNSLSTTQNNNNRASVDGEKSTDYLTFVPAETTAILTLGEGTTTGTWCFYDEVNEGYLYAASSSRNYLRTKSELDDNGSWTIDISGNEAVVTAQGTNTNNILRYNSGSNLFSCYASGQQTVFLYQKGSGSTFYTTILAATHEHTPAEPVIENNVAPTCTETGHYDSVIYCSVCNEELSREHTEIPATGHAYGAPEWTWSADNTAATAKFTCANCGDVQTLEAVITETVLTEAQPHVAGEKKLTATVTFNEIEYTDEKTVEIEALPCPCADFEDMPEYGTPEHEAIDWAFVNGITAGLSATEFGTNKTLNRAQAATFLYAAADKPEVDSTATLSFNDVVPSNWYYTPVLWASTNGLVTGYGDNTFKPNNTLTRAQILTILYAWADRPDVSEYQNPYTDVRASNWYYAPAVWAYNAGIERGENGKFAQGTLCTRAAFVLYLYRHMTGNCLLED